MCLNDVYIFKVVKMHMTVGKKIGFGFSVLVVMLIGLGSFSFYTSQFAQKGFSSFKTMSLTGRVQANILMMRLHALKFFDGGSKKSIDLFWERSEKVDRFLNQTLDVVEGEKRRGYLNSIQESLKVYRSKFTKLEKMFKDREILVNGEYGVNNLGPQIEKKFSKIMQSAYEDNDPSAAYFTAEALRVLLIARLRVLKYLDNNDPSTGKEVILYLNQLRNKTKIMDKEIQNPIRRKLMSEGMMLSRKYENTFNKITELITVRNALIADMGVLGGEFATKIEDIKLSIKADQDKVAPSMAQALENSKRLSIGVSILAVILGFGIAFWLVRSVSSILREVTAGLKVSSQQVEIASEKMLNASTTLKAGVEDQASSVVQTSASLEEISKMVESNVASSQRAMELSSNMREESAKGNQVMKQLQASMKDISDSNIKIEELVDVIGNIASKTKVMNEIAFQTKLLSLNASIEAEKAGNHGKGFAVVAEEVGNLAQTSSEAAKEIGNIVKDSIQEAKVVTETNKKSVEMGNQYLEQTAETLELILSSSGSVAEGSKQVSIASSEQSTGIQEINKAVSNLDHKIQETAVTANQTMETSQGLGAEVGNLKTAVLKLTMLIEGEVKKKPVGKTQVLPLKNQEGSNKSKAA